MHHVDHARGQPDFHEDLADELHEIGRLGGGFEDEGIAHGNGVGNEPAEDQGREVEGSHPAEHAQGLAYHLGRDIGGDVIQGVALDRGRRGRGGFQDFDHPLHFAARFGNMLGLVQSNGLGQFFQVPHHAVMDFVDIGHALADGEIAPGPVGRMGRGDGRLSRGRAGNGHAADFLAGGGVVERHALAACLFLPFAVDEIFDLDVRHGVPSAWILVCY